MCLVYNRLVFLCFAMMFNQQIIVPVHSCQLCNGLLPGSTIETMELADCYEASQARNYSSTQFSKIPDSLRWWWRTIPNMQPHDFLREIQMTDLESISCVFMPHILR